LKKSTGSLAASIVMIAIIVFLAVDAGFALYQPDRLKLSLPFCVLDIISGDVLVLPNDALTWEKAGDGLTLEPGTRIKTSTGAEASISFTGGTTTKLEPGTDIVIEKIEEGRNMQPYTVVLKQQSGRTWNRVDKTSGDISFQIRTASAEIQVHGTLFSTEVDAAGKTTVQTTEGNVGVSAGGKEVIVGASAMTEVVPHGTPSAPAPLPEARNELVITVNNPVFGLVRDSSGSGTGFFSSGAEVNQITGSSITADGASARTIRLREPAAGDYTLSLNGVADGTSEVTVEGFVGGESAFRDIFSCNITAARETLLKLHYEVIDGLLQRPDSGEGAAAAGAALAAQLPGETAAGENSQAPEASGKQEDSSGGFSWLGGDNSSRLTRLLMVGFFLFLVGIIFIIWRRSS
jgi:hypothetical protein